MAERRVRPAAKPPRNWPAKREDGGNAVPLELALEGYLASPQTARGEIVIVRSAAALSSLELRGFVSSYIGETEKSIDALFARAEEVDVSLFFDEADALFGERAENGEDKSERRDMIVLDPAAGRWLGQIYLGAHGRVRAGVYSLRGLYSGYRRTRRPWWRVFGQRRG